MKNNKKIHNGNQQRQNGQKIQIRPANKNQIHKTAILHSKKI